MRYYRLLPLLVLPLGLLPLLGAFSATRPSQAPLSPLPAEIKVDGAALEVLDKALEMQDPRRIIWLEMGIWQKVSVQGLEYEAEGRFLSGPNRRFRLELKTHLGNSHAMLLLVGTGEQVRRALHVESLGWLDAGPAEPAAAAANGAAAANHDRLNFFTEATFQGLAPLLENLQHRLVWYHHEMLSTDTGEQILLAGVRPPMPGKAVSAGDDHGTAGQPERCQLYLDARTLMPLRVEWWGPYSRRSTTALLAQLEFRNPRLNQPLPPERCAVEFALSHEGRPVTPRPRKPLPESRLF